MHKPKGPCTGARDASPIVVISSGWGMINSEARLVDLQDNSPATSTVICIAAALIDDGEGRVFLVRKRDTAAFMQPGGKIDQDETPFQTLARELTEELSFAPDEAVARLIGTFSAPAANEPDHRVEAQIFHIRACGRTFTIGAELEQGIWVSIDDASKLPLAPLTRDHMLPLARILCSENSSRAEQ
jgi:8-oxo-dGTP diphosphatase